eukprot:363997-Chlamydomonas_euryale.AAC.3
MHKFMHKFMRHTAGAATCSKGLVSKVRSAVDPGLGPVNGALGNDCDLAAEDEEATPHHRTMSGGCCRRHRSTEASATIRASVWAGGCCRRRRSTEASATIRATVCVCVCVWGGGAAGGAAAQKPVQEYEQQCGREVAAGGVAAQKPVQQSEPQFVFVCVWGGCCRRRPAQKPVQEYEQRCGGEIAAGSAAAQKAAPVLGPEAMPWPRGTCQVGWRLDICLRLSTTGWNTHDGCVDLGSAAARMLSAPSPIPDCSVANPRLLRRQSPTARMLSAPSPIPDYRL